MATLDRQAYLESGPKLRKIKVDGLDGELCIRSISARDRREFFKLYGDDRPDDAPEVPYDSDVWAVTRGLCDEAGNRLLKDSDAERVQDRPLGELSEIARQILELSGMTPTAVEESEGN